MKGTLVNNYIIINTSLPMEEISTQQNSKTQQMQNIDTTKPNKKTLDFIRQFARIYFPVANTQGLVLN